MAMVGSGHHTPWTFHPPRLPPWHTPLCYLNVEKLLIINSWLVRCTASYSLAVYVK